MPVAVAPGRGAAIVALFVAAVLAPFLNRAYHIDDTLFVRLGEQVLEHPLEPFQFNYNWFVESETFWKCTQNPPLNGYFIAAVAAFTGTREVPQHLAFMAFAIGCGLLTYSLARRFCVHPLLAAMLCVITPGFLVSACSVMADVPLLFFWLLAVWGTVRHLDTRRAWPLWIAIFAASAAAMTKYFGISLVPLLAVYVVMKRRSLPASVIALGIPVLVLVAWGFYAEIMSGIFHPLGAAQYSVDIKKTGLQIVRQALHSLAFLGGTMIWPVLALPLIGKLSKRMWVLVLLPVVPALWIELEQTYAEAAILHAIEVAGGALLVVVALDHLKTKRDADTTLLVLWLLGTMVFCAFLNWVVNARVILPAIVPAALLMVRWVETFESPRFWLRWLQIAAVPAFALSFLVALADAEFANAARSFAQNEVRGLIAQGKDVHFAGHWGWQFYMEEEGASIVNYNEVLLDPGDYVAYPLFNTSIVFLGDENAKEIAILKKEKTRFLVHTSTVDSQAGFYSDLIGIVPFNYNVLQNPDIFMVERLNRGIVTRK